MLITSELTNQSARKALFTCVVYTNLSYLLHEEERKTFAKPGYSEYQIELFGTEIDLSKTNQQRGRQTQPKHHTYKDHKLKLKTQPVKLLHVSEVTGCCFIFSFQGLEDNKGFIAVTLHEGCRVGTRSANNLKT